LKAYVRTGRIFLVKVEEGEHPHRAIEEILSSQDIKAAWITGIGGFSWARIGVFDPSAKKYDVVDVEPVEGHVLEVASIKGNSIVGGDERYYTHLHVTIARQTSEVYAGHLVDAHVSPFLEILVAELVGDYKSISGMFSHRWS